MNPHSYRLKGRDFVHQGKIEIDVNERAVFIRTQGCFFVYTNSDCFLNSLWNWSSVETSSIFQLHIIIMRKQRLKHSFAFLRPNISEKGAMPMDFSWELLFELLGKVADTIGNVLGGTKKD